MLKAAVTNIKEFILEKNTYFNNGYSDVYQNEEVGLVLSGNNPVFPADLGNYFYLRLHTNVTFSNGGVNSIADSIKGVGLNVNIVLVAIVKEAKHDILLQNLVNTIQAYCGEDISFNGATYNSDEVIRQELSFMTQDARDKAMANLPDNLAIVSLSFTYSAPFTFNNCIYNPCTC